MVGAAIGMILIDAVLFAITAVGMAAGLGVAIVFTRRVRPGAGRKLRHVVCRAVLCEADRLSGGRLNAMILSFGYLILRQVLQLWPCATTRRNSSRGKFRLGYAATGSSFDRRRDDV